MREDYGKLFDEMIESCGNDVDLLDIARDVCNMQQMDLMQGFEREFMKTQIQSAFSSYESMKDFVGISYLRQILSAENHIPEGLSDEELAVCAEKMKSDEGFIDKYLTLLEKSAN